MEALNDEIRKEIRREVSEEEGSEETTEREDGAPRIDWSGTHLGPIERFESLCTSKEKTSVWELFLPGGTESIYGLVRPLKDTMPVVLDELKSIFGLAKIGSHVFEVSGRRHVVWRYHEIVDPSTGLAVLSDDAALLPLHSHFEEFKNLFAFREICGVSKTTARSVVLSKTWRGPDVAVSLNETAVEWGSTDTVVPKTALKVWFGSSRGDLRERVREMVEDAVGRLGEPIDADLNGMLFALRSVVSATIERIDREKIGLAGHIVSRLTAILSYP